MVTNAEALAMFEEKKAKMGLNKETKNNFKALAKERLSKDKEARRPKDSRTPGKTVCYLALLLIGVAIGISSGVCSFGGAYKLFGLSSNLIGNMWWISLISTILLLGGIKSQMDSIRETIFTEKKGDQIVHVRIRRRHEVILTVIKRVIIGLVVASIVAVGLHYGIIYYKTNFHVQTGMSVVPTLGLDVFFVLFILLCTLLMLVAAELSLRMTQKEGITYQGATIFLSATLFSTGTIYFASTLLS